MSTNARNLVEDGNKKPSTGILTVAYNWVSAAFTLTPAYGKVVSVVSHTTLFLMHCNCLFDDCWCLQLYQYARQIGWFVVTTGMITLLPLVFEVRREAAIEQAEVSMIEQGLREGKTPQELHQMGLTAAVEPRVLN